MRMRGILVESCYLHAGEDPVMSDACDMLEKDTNLLLWNSLDYYDMLKYNKQKYVFVYGKLPKHLFNDIAQQFQPIKEEMDELLDEVDEHKMVVLNHIKEYINKRSKGVMIFSDAYPDHPKPHIMMYKLNVKQTLPDRKAQHIEIKLPSPVRLDGSTDLFDESPYEPKFQMYKGDGSTAGPVSVEKTKTGLAHDHHQSTMSRLFKTDDPEEHPIKAKLIKDYGEEAEIMTLPGEPPKDFMEEYRKSNDALDHNEIMEEQALVNHHNRDIIGHDYGHGLSSTPESPRALEGKNGHIGHRFMRVSHKGNGREIFTRHSGRNLRRNKAIYPPTTRKFKKWHRLV
jgi:hypothetical protein